MDSFLITLIVIIIAALSNWLQQRAQSRQESSDSSSESQPRPRPTTPRGGEPLPRPRRTAETSLERELRRLLGDDRPATPSHPPVHPQESHPRPHPAHVPPPVLTPPLTSPPVTLSTRPVAATQAAHLHSAVTEHLRHAHKLTETPRPPSLISLPGKSARKLSPALAVRSNPAAAREAFVASLVFGKPKVFEL